MHPNPIFHDSSQDRDIAFVRARAFGMLTISTQAAPLISHIPFQLSADGTRLEAHLVRSNPILRNLDAPTPATVIVSGGDCYVSPDWYGVPDQVPTWNYIAVHLSGTLTRSPQSALRRVLDRLSEGMETRIPGKAPWQVAKMTPEVYEKMARQIVPIEMQIEQIDSTWKLSQNKPQPARDGAKSGIAAHPMGAEVQSILNHMR